MAAKVPASLKPIAHYIKIANENSSRDPVVYYWCLFYAVQTAMQLDKSSPEALQFLTGLLSTLEAIKKQLAGTDAITNEVVAQAHLENFALKLFNFADAKEKSGQVDKSVVHAFYTAGHVMDVLSLFGEVDEQFLNSKKYAKWKSTQIFACLKDGTPYVPSSQQEQEVPHPDSAPGSGPVPAPRGAPAPVEHRYPETGSGSTSSSGNIPFYPGQNSPASAYPPPLPHQPQQPQSNYGFAGLPNVPGAPNSYPSQPQQPTYPTPMNTIVQDVSGLNLDSSSTHSLPAMDVSQHGDSTPGNERKPPVEAFNEARKFTKYALSAIDYEDTRAVVENLRKALALMERF